ncbi:hypothetical protein C7974DRAFT_420451 [Boeremia exigua]|uniref:uncharacterized protein n=1 Tax=Boeremia exigua TaxID=749465 RepID=UPI001E8D506E|nr:uncharacterized protein C7974DRAFT_420451 [Boeremia exigua]KAH6642117.1 hypothetical protein C7974DRAFT_420451 [Boeremia exigua]
MGIPYSREINAAFSQVTPLVAAGYTLLRTTKNISLLLAAIQVLTVILLGLILAVLVGILVCVNPDLEEERQQLITPWLRYYAHITLFGVFKTLATVALVVGAVAYAGWRLVLFERWVEDVEFEANVDANAALEDLGEGEAGKKGKKGKGKKSEAEKVVEEQGK